MGKLTVITAPTLRRLLEASNQANITKEQIVSVFNANGELVLPSTKKPSEGQVLFDEILNALKN